ncbi:MAG: MFS transporter [Bacteroidales bacterium]|nr:MFS transporter [Bacteroidales bacterium]
MTQSKSNSNVIAVITMIFLFGMISFVTNLAAPIGNIWKMQPGIEGSNALGMMGNMMNFLAYAIMGIPAGNLLKKKGYKFTAEAALLVGFVGVFVQYLSGVVAVGSTIGNIPANFFVYLLGAFICGFSVCMLNTVVNPMLKILGGKRANQYIQIGGSFNSLMGTLTPMLVGAMIGELVKGKSQISDVNTLLFMAMGVFAVAFIILLFVPIQDPEATKVEGVVKSPLKYRHFVIGAIAIFVYVGLEVGIPGTLNFYLSDPQGGAGLDPATAAAIAGFVAGTYWFLMLIGRLVSSVISGKVSSRTQLICVSSVALALIVLAIILGNSSMVSMPVFKGQGFGIVQVPIAALLLVLCGLCTSVMWGTIFDLSVEGLGAATEKASGIFMAMVVGGGIVPLVQNWVADKAGYLPSYWVLTACVAFILYFALIGSKVANKE